MSLIFAVQSRFLGVTDFDSLAVRMLILFFTSGLPLFVERPWVNFALSGHVDTHPYNASKEVRSPTIVAALLHSQIHFFGERGRILNSPYH